MFGWLGTVYYSKYIAKKQYSFDKLASLRHSEHDKDKITVKSLAQMVRNNPNSKKLRLTSDIWNNPSNNGKIASLKRVLDDFEGIAVGIHQGDLDEYCIKETHGSSAKKLYDFCLDFIPALRDEYQQPSAYEHFEKLALRWTQVDKVKSALDGS